MYNNDIELCFCIITLVIRPRRTGGSASIYFELLLWLILYSMTRGNLLRVMEGWSQG